LSIERIKIGSQKELEQMITDEISQVEQDLNMICNHVPINDKTTLDVLCHDANGQLVILQVSVNEDDIMLVQGMQSLDYIDKFKSFLKATYNKQKIDDKEEPRLILLAPSFSDALRRAVESMKGIRIDLYEWEYLKLGDKKGLHLQSVLVNKTTGKPQETSKFIVKKTSQQDEKPVRKKETEPFLKREEPEKDLQKPEELQIDETEFPQSTENLKEDNLISRSKKEEPPKKKRKLF